MTTLGLGGVSPVDVREVSVDSAGLDYIVGAGLYAVVYVKNVNVAPASTTVQINGTNFKTFDEMIGIPVFLNSGDVYALSGGGATANVFVAEFNNP